MNPDFFLLCQYYLVTAIFVEAVVEILVSAKIFFSFRNYLQKHFPKFIGPLFNCGYCLSVWVSMVAILLPGNFISSWHSWLPPWDSYLAILDAIIRVFILHRLSNLWHGFIGIMVNRTPWHFVITHIQETGDGAEESEEFIDERADT
jgi:hypothetical protein